MGKQLGSFSKRMLAFGAIILGLAILGGEITGIWMIQDKRPISDALWVMGLPLLAVAALGMFGAGIYSYTRAKASATSLRLRIIGVLGLVLIISAVGILILHYQGKTVPGEFIAISSSIAGGLIGFLNPPSKPSVGGKGSDGSGNVADDIDTDPAVM